MILFVADGLSQEDAGETCSGKGVVLRLRSLR